MQTICIPSYGEDNSVRRFQFNVTNSQAENKGSFECIRQDFSSRLKTTSSENYIEFPIETFVNNAPIVNNIPIVNNAPIVLVR